MGGGKVGGYGGDSGETTGMEKASQFSITMNAIKKPRPIVQQVPAIGGGIRDPTAAQHSQSRQGGIPTCITYLQP